MYGVTGSPPTRGVRGVNRSHVLYGSRRETKLSCPPAAASLASRSKTSRRKTADGHGGGLRIEYLILKTRPFRFGQVGDCKSVNKKLGVLCVEFLNKCTFRIIPHLSLQKHSRQRPVSSVRLGEETVFNRNWPVKSAEYLENPIIFLSSTLKLHSYMFRITAYFRLPSQLFQPLLQLLPQLFQPLLRQLLPQ